MKSKQLTRALAAGVLVLGVSVLGYFAATPSITPVWSPGDILRNSAEADHQDGKVYKIIDSSNKMLSQMSRSVSVGDELITGSGRHYKVKTVDGFKAQAEFTGMDRELVGYMDEYENITVPVASQQDWKNRPVALYHTHSAESYVPTDGTESKPYNGGIFDVGDAMAAELKKKGVNVLHDKTPHEPRDTNAYYRSRRTVVDLMKKNPVAVIDVHRDGIPDPNYYSKQIDGKDATQLRLVVGRQNPKMQSNMEFAKKSMAYANKVQPGLIKEIFIAKGNYNQDLMSTAMLVEVGTHTNSKIAAENGATLFADVLPGLLGLGGVAQAPGGYTSPAASSPASWRTLIWVIGVAVLGGGIFLLISSGSWQNARKRLSGFWGREFAGFMAPMRKRNRQSGVADLLKEDSEDANDALTDNRDNVRRD